MNKFKTIDFLKEKKKVDKIFIFTFLILIYLLVFQGVSYVNTIKNLENEVSQMKISLENSKPSEASEIKKSTVLNSTNEVYDLLGSSNIKRVCINNNKVEVEAKCEDLKILDELKKIRNISVSNIEKNENDYIFKAVYEIGGIN